MYLYLSSGNLGVSSSLAEDIKNFQRKLTPLEAFMTFYLEDDFIWKMILYENPSLVVFFSSSLNKVFLSFFFSPPVVLLLVTVVVRHCGLEGVRLFGG